MGVAGVAGGAFAQGGRHYAPSTLRATHHASAAAIPTRTGAGKAADVLPFAASAVAATVGCAAAMSRAQAGRRAARVSRRAEGESIVIEQPTLTIDINKLEDYDLAKLEEVYIDSLYWYYKEGKAILNNKEYETLKQELYKRESAFPTLTRREVAFVEAAIAYYRGSPIMSDEEYTALKNEVQASGARKDVTAFLLYQRAETVLDDSQYQSMKGELEKLGIMAVDLDKCTLAQLEEMYVDVLWAYYHDGVELLTNDQYDKLKMELDFQASGFPSLRRYEIDFVKASIAFHSGAPVVSDEEWKELKEKVLAGGKRKDVTAFLLYSKGVEQLKPAEFEVMKDELAKMGVSVQKVGTKALQETISVTSDKLKNSLSEVIFMVSALAALPTIASTLVVWSIGLFLDFEFVPQYEWGAILTEEFIPLFAIGLVLGVAITNQMMNFLDLQNPSILCGECPSCSSEVKIFRGGAEPPAEVKSKCNECGCSMVLNTERRRITAAGVGTRFGPNDDDGFDFKKAWGNLKDRVIG
mmetsp:Transcript_51506/g.151829  ORF Transcript_51506/g.151829 Transcript_51506/m.151829 type:complete len:525 (-) Transcript_51506:308-1882(-)